jgi:hypothetical protein
MVTPLIESHIKDKEQDINTRQVNLKNFAAAHKAHQSSKFSRVFANTWLTFLRIITLVIALVLVVSFGYFLLSDHYILLITGTSDSDVKIKLEDSNRYLAFALLFIGLLFYWLSFQLKRLKNKNKTIARLSGLIATMMEAEKNNIDKEKQSILNLKAAINPGKDAPASDSFLQ